VSQVNTAVVGLGFMGSRWALAMFEHPAARLAFVSDVREDLGREIADALNTRYVRDPLEAAADSEVDGVVICTPEHLHVEPAVAAIEAGKAVMVEKPLAHTVVDAELIRDRAANLSVPVLVGHILRFEPRYAAAARAVRDGDIGAVQAIRGERVGLIGTQSILQGRTSIALYLAVHEFDLARWFAGEVKSLSAHKSAGVLERQGYEVDDLYSALLRFESGAHGTVLLGWLVPDDYPGRGLVGLTVIGESGVVRIDQDALGFVKVGKGGKEDDFFFDAEVEGKRYGVLSIEADHFVKCVQGTAEPLCTASDATEAVRLSLAMESSAQSGAPIYL
jgi:predicted dehydrogenase